jgi:hypothetical protein
MEESMITVNWTIKPAGVQVSGQYPERAPLKAVKSIVLASAEGVNPGDADNYKVMDMNGATLDDSKSLADNGVADNARLILTQ